MENLGKICRVRHQRWTVTNGIVAEVESLRSGEIDPLTEFCEQHNANLRVGGSTALGPPVHGHCDVTSSVINLACVPSVGIDQITIASVAHTLRLPVEDRAHEHVVILCEALI